MANNVNNGITGVIDIPGALRSRGAADGNQVGGVVAYAGDIYDVTAGKNQATLNAEFAEGITNASSSSFSGNYNDLSNIPLQKTAENGFKVNAHDRRKNTASAQDSFAEGAGTTASGEGSHSEGGGTIASGMSSHAEGSGASAFGDSSHAEGGGTTATGSKSHAEGNQCSSYGSYSHAEGDQVDARGDASHAEGSRNKALGNYSHAEGRSTQAKADKSHAEGYNTTAEGENSHAEGSGSHTLGNASHSEGSGSLAEGVASHAEGYNTEAEADKSHAEGESTHAIGESSHAEGVHTVTTNEAEHASGMYNMSTANKTLFSVGAGHDGSRMNAFEIDMSSNVYIYGVGGFDGTNSTTTGIKSLQGVISDIESNSSSSSSSYTHPSTHPASMITYSSSETYTSGTVGYAIKQLETTGGGAGTSSGGISQSPQSGTNLSPSRTNTSFNQSTNHDKLVPAELTTHLGQNSACSGKDTYSTGVSSFASGDNVLAKGDNSAAFGEGSFAFGDGSISVGVNDVMPCYIHVSEDSSYTGGSPRRYDVTIQPTQTLQNYDNEEVLDNMIIAIMPNHTDNAIDGIVYAQLFDVYFDVEAQDNRFGQYMHAKVYISDEDREVPYEYDGQQTTHTIGDSENAYYGLLCRSANGKSSATIGKNLMTSNEGEVAVGNSNVSHKKQTNLAGTIFSVGARGLVTKAERSNTNYDEWAQDEDYDPDYEEATTVANVNAFFNTADCSSPSNALEVLDDGKVFIRGIGGFNGLNSTASGVKSVQQVITELTQQIAALTNNQ